MKISERNMINMERKALMTISREDSMRAGTTIVMISVSVHSGCSGHIWFDSLSLTS